MAELANEQSEWKAATKARITIGLEKGPLAATIQKAAEKGGFQLIGSPIYFKVETIDAGGINEIASFDHFVERVIHMPANASLAVSTAVAWDDVRAEPRSDDAYRAGWAKVGRHSQLDEQHLCARIQSFCINGY